MFSRLLSRRIIAASMSSEVKASPNFGKLEMNQSRAGDKLKYTTIDSLNGGSRTINFIGRIHKSNPRGPNLLFLILRQDTKTIQTILRDPQIISFVASIPIESIVRIEARISKPKVPISGSSFTDLELQISKLFVVSEAERVPFSISEASKIKPKLVEGDYSDILLDTRLNNRVIDLRTPANHAIFKIQAGVSRLFRKFLEDRNFIEIHTPKLIGAASEGGSSVFKVSYFKDSAFLAQSPQLYKQMMISADFGKVYEIAPVFRAENSMTHRHLTEFMGLDLEMTFNEHYHEVLTLLGNLFNAIFKGLEDGYAGELNEIQTQFPFEKFEYLPIPLILTFAEGIMMLRESGIVVGDFDDLNTQQERTLGMLVKTKYQTDFFILDKFPRAIRPFYTMPDPELPVYLI